MGFRASLGLAEKLVIVRELVVGVFDLERGEVDNERALEASEGDAACGTPRCASEASGVVGGVVVVCLRLRVERH